MNRMDGWIDGGKEWEGEVKAQTTCNQIFKSRFDGKKRNNPQNLGTATDGRVAGKEFKR